MFHTLPAKIYSFKMTYISVFILHAFTEVRLAGIILHSEELILRVLVSSCHQVVAINLVCALYAIYFVCVFFAPWHLENAFFWSPTCALCLCEWGMWVIACTCVHVWHSVLLSSGYEVRLADTPMDESRCHMTSTDRHGPTVSLSLCCPRPCVSSQWRSEACGSHSCNGEGSGALPVIYLLINLLWQRKETPQCTLQYLLFTHIH